MVSINFFAEEISLPDIDQQKIIRWIVEVASIYNHSVGELSYIFCNDEKIIEVNRNYLNHDFYTDIITFDYTEESTISGDIFISVDTVFTNSQLYQTTFENELHRVIIHGVLHLCGLNDESDDEQERMRSAENSALELFENIS